jgi:peroxygenase
LIPNNDIIYKTCRFVPEKFEEIFKKHSHTKPNALTGKELQEMLQANREPKDFKGW